MSRSIRRRHSRRVSVSSINSMLLAAGVAGVVPSVALAATDTWSGGGGDNNFKTPANWVGSIVPVPGDVLAFDGASRFTPNNNFATGTQFGGLTFNATAAGPFT